MPYVSSFGKVVHFDGGPETSNTKSSIFDPMHCSKNNKPKAVDNYRSFGLNIYLNAIKFLDSKPEVKIIEFR